MLYNYICLQLFFYSLVFFILNSTFLFSEVIGNLKICALRISFPIDSVESTTGNGQFLTEYEGIDCSNYTIDKPPHDRSYFKSQIQAVSSYFDSVSYGDFNIDLENTIVLPAGINDSYEIQNPMSYYNPYDSTDNVKEKRISELFEDAINFAYELDKIQFYNHDLIVVFHAGIGQDFSLPFLDPTPQDLPSTYIDNKMIQDNIEGASIIIDGHEILHGIILQQNVS